MGGLERNKEVCANHVVPRGEGGWCVRAPGVARIGQRGLLLLLLRAARGDLLESERERMATTEVTEAKAAETAIGEAKLFRS